MDYQTSWLISSKLSPTGHPLIERRQPQHKKGIFDSKFELSISELFAIHRFLEKIAETSPHKFSSNLQKVLLPILTRIAETSPHKLDWKLLFQKSKNESTNRWKTLQDHSWRWHILSHPRSFTGILKPDTSCNGDSWPWTGWCPVCWKLLRAASLSLRP